MSSSQNFERVLMEILEGPLTTVCFAVIYHITEYISGIGRLSSPVSEKGRLKPL